MISFITLGIYYLYWVFKSHEEIKEHSGQGIGGVLGLVIAILLGFITPFVLPSEIRKMYEQDGRVVIERRRQAVSPSGELQEEDARIELDVVSVDEFEADVLAGHLHVEALTDGHAITARGLLSRLEYLPLRTLDAFHLAIAQSLAVGVVATADGVIARAAEALGMTVVMFGRRRR